MKHFNFTIFFIGFLSLTLSIQSQIPTNGLVASFPFNGNALDETGSGHNGFVYGATLTSDRCGRPNSAYYFNGTDSYIKVTNNNINSPNFTYAVWINFQPIASYQNYNILEIGNGTGGPSGVKWGQEIQIMSLGAKGVFTVISGDFSGTYNGMNTMIEAIPNQWYLVVFTRSNTELKIYINDQIEFTGPTFGQTTFFNNPLEILIGGRSNTFYEYFRGCIDDIRMYDRVLSDTEISSLYNSSCSQQNLDSINGSSEVCTGQQNVSYKVPHLPGATISWAYSGTGATILNGTADSITINFSSIATNGILTVTATGTNIPTQSQELPITVADCSGPPTTGLVAYYPFNGNANDESGNGNDAQVSSVQPTTDRCLNPNSAYYFNGSSKITLPASFDLPSRTIDLWFNTEDINYNDYNYGAIYESDNPSLNYGATGFALKKINGILKLILSVSGISDTINISASQWYNAAIVVGADKVISYYLNGIQFGIKTYTNALTSTEGSPTAFVGCGRFGNQNYFQGKIDDVRVYNRSLDSAEVLSLYNEPCSLKDISGPANICPGESAVYTTNLLNDATYTWSYSGDGATYISPADSCFINFANNATSGILKVTVTGPNIIPQSKEISISMDSCKGIPSSGLVASYMFNGNGNDDSGNGNNALLNTAQLSTDRCGKPNSAYYFNGTSAYIQIQNNSIRNNNYTYSIWVKMQETPPSLAGYCIYEIGSVPNSSYGQVLGISNDYTSNYGSVVSSGNTNLNALVFPNNVMPDTSWYNAVVTRSDDSIKFYINAKLQFSKSVKGLTPFYTSPLYIFLGTRCEFFHYFKGKLDDFMVYNRALSDSEIASLYYTDCSNQLVSDINGSPSVCTGQKGVNYSVTPIAGATYSWSYTGTGESISGISNTVSVDFATNATSGNIQVEVSGPNITTQLKQFPVTVNICNQISTNGLIAYYPFNGNANDESGNGLDGTIAGATLTYDRCGIPNSAYYFNGASTIKVTSSKLSSSNFTYAAWFKFKTVPTYYIGSGAIILSLGANCGSMYGTAIGVSNPGYLGNTGCTVTSGNTDSTHVGFTTNSLPIANQWYFIVVSRSKDSVDMYINDKLVESQPTNGKNPFFNNPLELYIGTRCEVFNYFDGTIDDIRLYDRILSRMEISSLYYFNCSPLTLGAIIGSTDVCSGQQKVIYQVPPLFGASYSWNYTGSGETINGNSDSITIDFSSSASSGVLSVTATGQNIGNQSTDFPITVNNCSGPPTTGLVAYYSFNNGSLADESGNGNNLTNYGAIKGPDRCGRKDSAYRFNGINNYMHTFNNNLNTKNFTYALWLNLDALPLYDSGEEIMEIGSICRDGTHGGQSMAIDNNYSTYSESGWVVASSNISGALFNFYSTFMPEINKWYFFVLTRSDSALNLYINDQLIESTPTLGRTPYFSNPLDVFIGSRCSGFHFFNGSLDEIRMYNRVLTDSEIEALYNTQCNFQNLGEITGSSLVCQGQQGVNFNVKPLIGATYVWDYSGAGVRETVSDNNISLDFSSSATSGILHLTVLVPGMPDQSRDFPISVYDLPADPGIIIGQQSLCRDHNESFYIQPINEASNYIWDYSGIGAAITGKADSISIYFSNTATNGNLTVKGSNNCGIGHASEPFKISLISCGPGIASNIKIPNTFTPNGDNVNDVLVISGLPENSTLIIIDRTGKMLYESTNYQNNWDGKDSNNNDLDSGTYWYILTLPGIPTEFKGFVYIKR